MRHTSRKKLLTPLPDPPPQGGREDIVAPQQLATPSPSMGEGWGGGDKTASSYAGERK